MRYSVGSGLVPKCRFRSIRTCCGMAAAMRWPMRGTTLGRCKPTSATRTPAHGALHRVGAGSFQGLLAIALVAASRPASAAFRRAVASGQWRRPTHPLRFEIKSSRSKTSIDEMRPPNEAASDKQSLRDLRGTSAYPPRLAVKADIPDRQVRANKRHIQCSKLGAIPSPRWRASGWRGNSKSKKVSWRSWR
jgi:hypothetical protein